MGKKWKGTDRVFTSKEGKYMKLNLGCHLSVSKGYEHMGKEALSVGANTFQFFTRNPRGGSFKPPTDEDINALVYLMEEKFIKIMI